MRSARALELGGIVLREALPPFEDAAGEALEWNAVTAREPQTPLLGIADIRAVARALDFHPAKARGQNFVHDPGTVRRIVRTAGVGPGDEVLEVGPGFGSLTLALLEAGARVRAVEIDGALAGALAPTVAARMPQAADRLRVVRADARRVGPADLAPGDWGPPTSLISNLPYSVAVPVLLGLLQAVPQLASALVLVQAEVAQRLTAGPGSRVYGVPSVKLAWYGSAERAGSVSRGVFWPIPNVDSGLVRVRRVAPPPGDEALRRRVFALVDAAFAQRRKTLRTALRGVAGSTERAEALLGAAGVDAGLRGEALGVEDFVRLGRAAERLGIGGARA